MQQKPFKLATGRRSKVRSQLRQKAAASKAKQEEEARVQLAEAGRLRAGERVSRAVAAERRQSSRQAWGSVLVPDGVSDARPARPTTTASAPPSGGSKPSPVSDVRGASPRAHDNDSTKLDDTQQAEQPLMFVDVNISAGVRVARTAIMIRSMHKC